MFLLRIHSWLYRLYIKLKLIIINIEIPADKGLCGFGPISLMPTSPMLSKLITCVMPRPQKDIFGTEDKIWIKPLSRTLIGCPSRLSVLLL